MKKFKAEIYKQLCPITLKWNDQYLAHGRCKNRGSVIMSMILGVGVDPNKSLPLNNVFFKKKVNVFLNIANMTHWGKCSICSHFNLIFWKEIWISDC